MICVPHYVATSQIPHAGQGQFVRAAVPAGKVLVAPSKIQSTITLEELLDDANGHHADSSIRWFEDHCTVSPDWPDECFVNHSFEASGLWHLGFIFALRDLAPDTEITIDYRHLLAPGIDIGFADSASGQRIIGFGWADSLCRSTQQLHELLPQVAQLEDCRIQP
jgi:hypothetical protein